MSGQHEVIGFLSRADSYGCPGGTVERIETHGSLIFLCGERVYKLKREIAYASLDFLTLEKRERACHAELRLNRRTAPGLYLRVSAITRDRAGVLAFDADGEVLDWVVVMRRFPQSALFDRMAMAGELTPSLMQTLGVEVASAELFAAHFTQLPGDVELVAVSPDAGGAKRAESSRRALERHIGRAVGSAYMEKYRSNDIVTGTMLVGDVHERIAIIVDDLISTGGTLLRAGEACRKAGARQVHAAAAHGLFTGGPEILESPVFDQLVITDTVPPFRLPPELVSRRLTVLDSSAMVAAALKSEYG